MDRETKGKIIAGGKIFVTVIYVIVLSYVTILSIAFVLQLLGANPSANFANWIYRASDHIMEPFRGIFPTHSFSDRSVFDASMLFAIIMYGLLALLLHGIIAWCTEAIARTRRPAPRGRRSSSSYASADASPSGQVVDVTGTGVTYGAPPSPSAVPQSSVREP